MSGGVGSLLEVTVSIVFGRCDNVADSRRSKG